MNVFLINNKQKMFCFLQQDYVIPEIVIVTGLQCAWEFYINRRQQSLMQKLEKRPVYLEDIVSEADYEKARNYTMDRITFDIINDLHSTIYTTIDLVFKGCFFFWSWSEELLRQCGLDPQVEILTTATFIVITFVVELIVELPITIYDTFVLEQKHGFNMKTPGNFVIDIISGVFIFCVLVVPTICGLIWIVINTGKYFIIYTFLFVGFLKLLLTLIVFPSVLTAVLGISPIPDGELKQKIEELALSVEFPIEGIYIMQESTQSTHSNAYFMGLYNSNIILTDTLVQEYQKDRNAAANVIRGCTTDEILAIVAHELGHWHHGHVNKGLWFAQLESMIYLISYSMLWNCETLFKAFGFVDSQPILIRIIIIGYILDPINSLIDWKLAAIRRRDEFQADLYAKHLGYGDALKRALCKLYKDNLTYPIYDSLYSDWNFGHPTLLERLAALD